MFLGLRLGLELGSLVKCLVLPHMLGGRPPSLILGLVGLLATLIIRLHLKGKKKESIDVCMYVTTFIKLYKLVSIFPILDTAVQVLKRYDIC